MNRAKLLFAAFLILLSLSPYHLGGTTRIAFAAKISLRIADVTAPSEVFTGQSVPIGVSVKWSGFDRNARTVTDGGNTISLQPPVYYTLIVSLQQLSTTDENVESSGSKTYSFELEAPGFAGPWRLAAEVGVRLFYPAIGTTLGIVAKDSKDFTINVIAATTATPTMVATTTATEARTTTRTEPPTPTATTVSSPTATATETQFGGPGLPISPFLTAGVVGVLAIILLAAGYMYTRRKKHPASLSLW